MFKASKYSHWLNSEGQEDKGKKWEMEINPESEGLA